MDFLYIFSACPSISHVPLHSSNDIKQRFQIVMEVLPISSWNGTLQRKLDSIFQILNFNSNQADDFLERSILYPKKRIIS